MVKKVVITGGPGSGKTTLINYLHHLGYTVSEEVSRKIIREQSGKPQGILPWQELEKFAWLAHEQMQAEWGRFRDSQWVFFDRGIPDIQAYLNCRGIELPEVLLVAAREFPYHHTVFWCAPWPEIYENDPERPQSYNEAKCLGLEIRNVYKLLNYDVVEVPKKSIIERSNFILEMLPHCR